MLGYKQSISLCQATKGNKNKGEKKGHLNNYEDFLK